MRLAGGHRDVKPADEPTVHMMAQTSRGRSQNRKRVAGGQDYEVHYEEQKIGTSKQRVKGAVKKVGNSRGKAERELRDR